MRTRFDEQLNVLNRETIQMGSMIEQAIEQVCEVLKTHDLEAARLLVARDNEIDRKERDIESLCMRLLLRQQPVARDLHSISAALKMISDMERIGDQAADIAELSGFIRSADPAHMEHLRRMARETIKMVTDSVDSFVHRDVEAARDVEEYDDVVDGLFTQVKTELTALVAADGENAEMYLDLLMVAKYFERIGDHATNIAEWVEYSVTGKHENTP